jgi:surfactin synthase thioesterase subunit
MQFYSGFSLKDEVDFFEPFLDKSDFCVAGFSYGAIKAFKRVEFMLREGNRVDRLQLFSPAFFQTKDTKFKRLQLMAYRKNEEAYLSQFLNACFLPHQKKDVQRSITVIQELEELLEYVWDKEALKSLVDAGVTIEVYLGSEDKIVDTQKAELYFMEIASVTTVKNANHFLLTE